MTGIRRNELVALDISDDETAWVLKRRLRVRDGANKKSSPALFLNQDGNRLDRNGIYVI